MPFGPWGKNAVKSKPSIGNAIFVVIFLLAAVKNPPWVYLNLLRCIIKNSGAENI